tara:strand:- start:521 stop:757 length:237 start_codon:yes stop_codon:yes gene_type:complete
MIAAGYSNQCIAEKLEIRPSTVSNIVGEIYDHCLLGDREKKDLDPRVMITLVYMVENEMIGALDQVELIARAGDYETE